MHVSTAAARGLAEWTRESKDPWFAVSAANSKRFLRDAHAPPWAGFGFSCVRGSRLPCGVAGSQGWSTSSWKA